MSSGSAGRLGRYDGSKLTAKLAHAIRRGYGGTVDAGAMVKIRELIETDWPAVVRIHDAARPDELRGSCDGRAFIPLEQDPEVEALRACRILVATQADRVVGFAGIDGSYLGWLYVNPADYGQGIGRGLLRAALDLARGGPPWTIVLAGNLPAIRLYESEGFEQAARFGSDNAGYPCTCLRMEQPAG